MTATFCHNIANDLPIQISDPSNEIELAYIDDVVEAFTAELSSSSPGFSFARPLPSKRISLGGLAEKIKSFREMRTKSNLPDFRDAFERALYGTYLSYLDTQDFEYGLEKRSDHRGSLAEFLKSSSMGQIFVSHTKPGVTRGNHYHHTKTEKFGSPYKTVLVNNFNKLHIMSSGSTYRKIRCLQSKTGQYSQTCTAL